jgi:uncharacterized protein YaaW (UPF0174 family)
MELTQILQQGRRGQLVRTYGKAAVFTLFGFVLPASVACAVVAAAVIESPQSLRVCVPTWLPLAWIGVTFCQCLMLFSVTWRAYWERGK